MGKRDPEMPRDLASDDQRRLVVMAYWPRLRRGESHIGYGMARGYLWFKVAVKMYDLLPDAFSLLVRPKLLTNTRVLFARSWPLMAANIAITIATIRMQRPSGYYQLDDEGTPTRFLSKRIPPGIQGRVGTNRRAFLRQV